MNLYTERTSCRVCGFSKMIPILSLGNLFFSDFLDEEIQKSDEEKIPLELVLCNKKDGGCGLLQLKHTANQELMYRHYWYRSGINQTMMNALRDITRKVESLVQLKPEDAVIDIGANDGTLLRSYTQNVQRIGFEPAKNLMQYTRTGTTHVFNDFFNAAAWKKEFGDKKAKAVTAIAMFYDLEDPNAFVSDVRECLAEDGVFIIQMSYLPTMLADNVFDNICHEHLEYYSLLSLEALLNRNELEVFDVELNTVNGGSFRIYIGHKGQRAAPKPQDAGGQLKFDDGAKKRIYDMRAAEEKLGLNDKAMYTAFAHRVESQKEKLMKFIEEEKSKGKKIYAYGASTKGNTLLQYYNLNRTHVSAAADRNPDKWGKKTVGTNIPIIAEDQARQEKPDYFLILPWAFLNEFKSREAAYLQEGGQFIVPLPEFTVLGNR